MAEVFDTSIPAELAKGLRQARLAIGRKQVVVIPTDTGYALAANAFSAAGVSRLREVKGWSTKVPPQVLLPGFPTLAALASEVSEPVKAMTTEFWPGALTVIVPAQESLQWDLGDNQGTVSLRMPAHLVASELLAEIGPLAVSQANKVGNPLASLDEILTVFGDEVGCVLADPTLHHPGQPSTVVDASSWGLSEGKIRIARVGQIPVSAVIEVLGEDIVELPPGVTLN